MRVMQPIMPLAIEGTRHFMVDDVTARLNEARQYLASVAADLRGRGVRVTTNARHGDPGWSWWLRRGKPELTSSP